MHQKLMPLFFYPNLLKPPMAYFSAEMQAMVTDKEILLAQVEGRLDDLIYKRIQQERMLKNKRARRVKAETELAMATGEKNAYEAILPTMPEGVAKQNLENEILERTNTIAQEQQVLDGFTVNHEVLILREIETIMEEISELELARTEVEAWA